MIVLEDGLEGPANVAFVWVYEDKSSLAEVTSEMFTGTNR